MLAPQLCGPSISPSVHIHHLVGAFPCLLYAVCIAYLLKPTEACSSFRHSEKSSQPVALCDTAFEPCFSARVAESAATSVGLLIRTLRHATDAERHWVGGLLTEMHSTRRESESLLGLFDKRTMRPAMVLSTWAEPRHADAATSARSLAPVPPSRESHAHATHHSSGVWV